MKSTGNRKSNGKVLSARGFVRDTLKNALNVVLQDAKDGCRECSIRSGCNPDTHSLCKNCCTFKDMSELETMVSRLEEMGL